MVYDSDDMQEQIPRRIETEWIPRGQMPYGLLICVTGGLTITTGILAFGYYIRKDRLRLIISSILCAGFALTTVCLIVISAQESEW
jgi:hypothetical protein